MGGISSLVDKVGSVLPGAATGFFAGGPAGAIAGAGLSYLGQRQSRKTQQDAAAQAAEMARFRPFDIATPFGSSYFDTETGRAGGRLSPEYQDIRQSMLGRLPGLFQPTAVSGQLQGLGQQALGGAQGLFGQLAGGYDPAEAARQQYERLSAIAAPGEERARGALQSQLFSRGLTGSTAGGIQQESFEKAQAMKDLARESQAFAQAQDVQTQMQQRGLGLAKFGLGIEELPGQRQAAALGLGGQGLGMLQGIDRMALAPLELGAQIGGRQASAGAAAAQFPWQAGLNKADSQAAFWSGIGQPLMSQGISQLFGGGGGSPAATPTGGAYNPSSLFGTPQLGL